MDPNQYQDPNTNTPPAQPQQPYQPPAGPYQPQMPAGTPVVNPYQSTEPTNMPQPGPVVMGQPMVGNPVPTQPGMPPKKHRKLLLPIFAGAAILLVVGTIAAVALVTLTQQTPDKVFRSALQNSFSTQSFTQTLSQDGIALTNNFDVSNLKNPRLSAVVQLGGSGLNANFDGYGDMQDTFLKLSGGTTTVSNKWIQVRNQGKLPANADQAFYETYDPRIQFYGDFMLGNFSASQRQSLVDYITSQHVYSYNAAKVTSGSVDGQAVYVYPVTIAADKLKTLNQKVAAITGLDAASLKVITDTLVGNLQATLYVSKHNPHLLKAVDNTSKAVDSYSKFNATTVAAKPTASLQWADYYKQANDSVIGQLGQEQNTAKDTERQVDIKTLQSQLEAYYANSGHYPTFAQMNDSTWISSNLVGLDQSALQDPDGSGRGLAPTPTQNQYAYQVGADSKYAGCDNSRTMCLAYKLTATLSSGQPYSVTNLN